MRLISLKASQKKKSPLDNVELHGAPEDVASKFVILGVTSETHDLVAPRSSSLYDACMRAHALGKKYGIQLINKNTLTNRLTFGIGNAVHSWLQNDPTIFGDYRIGWWKCQSCGNVRKFGRQPKKKCKFCGAESSASIYHEHDVVAPSPFVCTGHPDMFFWSDKKLRLVEFKTMSSEMFKTLKQPSIEHVWQITFYMWACSQDGRLPKTPDHEVGYIMYVSKGQLSRSLPFKMFPVVNDGYILDRIKEKLDKYRIFVENGTLPEPHIECARTSFTSGKAKNCPVYRECKENV